MQDIISIHEDLERIKSALLQIFSEPLSEDMCGALINCFLDDLILHSAKTLDVSCSVSSLKMFLENKVLPCLVREGLLKGNQVGSREVVTMFDESNSPF